MLLLISSIDDPVMGFFVNWLRTHDKHYIHLLQEEHGQSWHLEWQRSTVTFHHQDFGQLHEKDITAIYARLAGVAPESQDGATHRYQTLEVILNTMPTKVINRPQTMGFSLSKPFQYRALAEHDLPAPPTCITNRLETLQEFTQHDGKRAIFKSLSSHRSLVQCVDFNQQAQIDRLSDCPVQFQKRIEGDNIRVHVIGNSVFPVKIASEAVDYRYSSSQGYVAEFEIVALPQSVAKNCIALSQHFNLEFSGIDLIETKQGEYHCLEVNSQPGYSSFERNAGIPLSEALHHHLTQ